MCVFEVIVVSGISFYVCMCVCMYVCAWECVHMSDGVCVFECWYVCVYPLQYIYVEVDGMGARARSHLGFGVDTLLWLERIHFQIL